MRRLAAAVIALAALTSPAGAASPRAPASVAAAPDYLREAAVTDLFERRAAELAQEKGRSATVMSLGIRLMQENERAAAGLADAASRAGLPVPTAELDADRARRIAELQGLSGMAFDKAFLAGQQAAYEQALALHAGYASSGSDPVLRSYAADAAARVRQRLAMLQAM